MLFNFVLLKTVFLKLDFFILDILNIFESFKMASFALKLRMVQNLVHMSDTRLTKIVLEQKS